MMFKVQNAYSHFRVSDTERSHRLMQVTKHLLRCEEASHLNAVRLLVEQTLGCCGRNDRDSMRVEWVLGLWLRYHAASISVHCAYLQTPGATPIMQCNRSIGWHQHLCRAARLSCHEGPLPGDEKNEAPVFTQTDSCTWTTHTSYNPTVFFSPCNCH